MKYYELDKVEERLLDDFETGKLKRAPVLKREQAKLKRYARATLIKAKNVNIRISEKDLIKLKSLAAGRGIPYQTLLASLIHQYSAGKLRDPVS